MAFATRFGPRAQPPEQLALAVAELPDASPTGHAKATAFSRQLLARYVAGILS